MSLIGAAGYMPENVVDNSYFEAEGAARGTGMFKGSKTRHHVAVGEAAAEMIERAGQKLAGELGLNLSKDVDLLLTNVTCLDMPFMGAGASAAKRLGIASPFVIDVHNSGCVSFVYMMAIARGLMASTGAKTAMICNVQNAAGRVFRHEENRKRAQSAVPGDGCGVGYLVANDESPVRSIVTHCYPDYADDMRVVSDDGNCWWERRTTAMHIDFTEERVASIVARGNKLVPAVVKEACVAAEVSHKAIDTLITNQPSHIFLRNWREALELKKEAHVDSFEEHGNLFGAALPINIARAVSSGRLKAGSKLVLGGFSHAGDYAAAAVIDWQPAHAAS